MNYIPGERRDHVVRSLKLYIVICVVLVLTNGCGKNMDITHSDNIALSLLNAQEMDAGITQTVELTNLTSTTIKQNAVYLSYPIVRGTSSQMNVFKVEATGSKLDIKPGEKVMLSIFVPKEDDDNPNLDIENPELEISGYFDDVEPENYFFMQGSIDYFSVQLPD